MRSIPQKMFAAKFRAELRPALEKRQRCPVSAARAFSCKNLAARSGSLLRTPLASAPPGLGFLVELSGKFDQGAVQEIAGGVFGATEGLGHFAAG